MHFINIELSPVSHQLLEERDAILATIILKMRDVSKEKLGSIVLGTVKRSLKDYKLQPVSVSSLKTLALSSYICLVGAGALTSYASLNLLINADPSSSSLNYANNITNVGALFASLTDLPAITYMVYLTVFRANHIAAIREVLDESYHLCVDGNDDLTSELHEELYQKHIAKLQKLGVDDYYLHPDLLSETGQLHAALAPILKEMDLQKNCSVRNNISNLLKNTASEFKLNSCMKKVAKATCGILSLGVLALSSFLVVESIILIKDSPVSDLFSNNKADQMNEAFYITQLGCLFSSITAAGAVSYMSYKMYLEKAYKKTMREKIASCFASLDQSDLSNSLKNALYRIKEYNINQKWLKVS